MSSVAEYRPPPDGDPESADPLFRPKVRPCGKCQHPFTTTAAFRYYCQYCRQLRMRQHSQIRGYETP